MTHTVISTRWTSEFSRKKIVAATSDGDCRRQGSVSRTAVAGETPLTEGAQLPDRSKGALVSFPLGTESIGHVQVIARTLLSHSAAANDEGQPWE